MAILNRSHHQAPSRRVASKRLRRQQVEAGQEEPMTPDRGGQTGEAAIALPKPI